MTDTAVTYRGRVFDGQRLRSAALWFREGVLQAILPEDSALDGAVIDAGADILAPGYVDLQVNGGDGVMLNDDPSVATMARMARAHRALGATTILPTLITDRPEVVTAAIEAATAACRVSPEGIAGLHLEGPHLSVARKGAHDAGLIRPMEDRDLQELVAAKSALPVLKVTLAPESVTPEQVQQLARAGVLVSLGHSDTDFATAQTYARAGARCVTHLFNAMSQMGNRAPGLVGAALETPRLSAGLIADGIHVHPATMRAAWAAKQGPGRIFLVSDAMAVAGTDLPGFALGGRQITRQEGRLTLADGTLAGADLDLTAAIRCLVTQVGVPLGQALASATSVPARLCGMPQGRLQPGKTHLTDVIRISADLSGATVLT